MTHIEVYAKLIKLKIYNKPVTPEIFKELAPNAPLDMSQMQLDLFLDPESTQRPLMNQLVQELISLGVKSHRIAKYYNVFPSAISRHKSNPIKSEYFSYFIEESKFGFPIGVTQINHERRRPDRLSKGDPDYKPRKRRTSKELQWLRDQQALEFYAERDKENI